MVIVVKYLWYAGSTERISKNDVGFKAAGVYNMPEIMSLTTIYDKNR